MKKQLPFVSVSEAETIVLSQARDFGTEKRTLTTAEGAILREEVLCDRDLPPFDRVTMDGIAVHTSAWQQGQRSFPIAFTQPAGAPEKSMDDPTSCVKVMTGAVLPLGTNAIIPREQVTFDGDVAHVSDEAVVEPMKFIHQKGGDAKKDSLALPIGTRIDSPASLIAASVGAHHVTVARVPSFAVVSNGDELVPIDQVPAPHQIRNSNTYALCAGLKQEGVQNLERIHLPDDKEKMLEGVTDALTRFDAAILTGGVSAGDFDYMPRVMEELSVKKLFHKVAQRPGKPFWFGVSAEDKPVFALPGNPVSTLVCFHRYIKPWLRKSLGLPNLEPVYARLTEDIEFTAPLTYFLQAVLSFDEDGSLRVTPAPNRGSGDYASLANTTGFAEFAADRNHFPEGTNVRYFSWK